MADFKGGVGFVVKGRLGKRGGAVFAEVNKGGHWIKGGRGLKKGGVGTLDGTMVSILQMIVISSNPWNGQRKSALQS